jgi:threonyl-tRNA synthetase
MAFWHSSAHILGSAIEQVFEEPQLTIGPSVKDGFFYDFYSPSGQVIKGEDDYKKLEKSIKQIIGKNYTFERLYLTKDQALDMFQYNRFKTELIEKKVAQD